MDSFATQEESHLVNRLSTWLALGCVFFGLCHLAQVGIVVLVNGLDMFRPAGFAAPSFRWYQVAFMVGMAASVLLLLGGLALWRRLPWGRAVLLVYVGLSILANIFWTVFYTVSQWSQWRQSAATTLPFTTVTQQLGLVALGLLQFVHNCLLPAIILVCLLRLGIGKYATAPSQGFQPVIPVER